MKTIAITILLACALLGVGCSGSDETVTTSPTTLSPQPDFPIDPAATPKDVDKTRNESPPPLVAATRLPVLTATNPTATPVPNP